MFEVSVTRHQEKVDRGGRNSKDGKCRGGDMRGEFADRKHPTSSSNGRSYGSRFLSDSSDRNPQ